MIVHDRKPDSDVRAWLDNVVIGLGLCPFAADPVREGRVRIALSRADGDEALLSDLHEEMVMLDSQPAKELETTLLVAPFMLAHFDDFNRFLGLADDLIDRFGWDSVYQIASFHPRYRFADAVSAASNLTNRAPCPVLQILREESIERALAGGQEPDRIVARNIKAVESLSDSDRRELFPWLDSGDAVTRSR